MPPAAWRARRFYFVPDGAGGQTVAHAIVKKRATLRIAGPRLVTLALAYVVCLLCGLVWSAPMRYGARADDE